MSKRTTALALGLLIAISPALASDTGHAPKTPRDQHVHDLVLKWAPHVQERFGVSPADWVRDMAGTFARADLDALAGAAEARTFDQMTQRLLGDAPTPADLVATLAGKDSPQALGDPSTDLVFVPLTPCRLIDTRVAGGAIAANGTRSFDVTDAASFTAQGGSATDCGIGNVGDVAAAVINFTVVTPNLAGYLTAYPFGASQPLASTVNYTAGDIRGNLATVRLDQSAAALEMTVYTFAQTHLVADVVGYFTNPAATRLNCVGTGLQSFNLPALTRNYFENTTCPDGYGAVMPYCYAFQAGVYSQGSGVVGNVPGENTFCAWQNTNNESRLVYGGSVCCRVPGR